LQSDQVIAGVKSWHHSRHEDRRFRLNICTLSPKCTELFDIKYHYDKAITSTAEVIAGQTKKDNMNHPQPGEMTTTFERSKQESLAQSYSFQRTKGHEFGYSLESSGGLNAEVPGLGGVETKITHGVFSTWSSTNTWTRSNTKTITEENGFQISFKDICPGNSYCTSEIKVEFGEAKIPYTMIASSKENSVKCVEEGILYVKNSWNAHSIVKTTEACKDKHPKCLEFSINGYCQNPTTMEVLKNQCPESCGHCENDGKVPNENIEKCNQANYDGGFHPAQMISGSCYRLSKTATKTWSEAKKICQSNGGNLFEPRSSFQSNAVFDEVRKIHKVIGIWIGLTDTASEGNWRYASDGSKVVYTNWNSDEPNNDGGDEDCAIMHTGFRHWFDYSCEVKDFFLCQF